MTTVFCVLCSPVRWLYVLSSWNVRENSAHCFSLLLTVFANYPWVATIIGHYRCIYLLFSKPTKLNLAHSLMGCLMGCLNSEIEVILNAAEFMRIRSAIHGAIHGMFDRVGIFLILQHLNLLFFAHISQIT